MVKNTNVLEKFIGKFVERLSLYWDEIVNMVIDELLIEEAYELNEIDLKKIDYEKNKNKLIKNLIKAGYGGIMPDNEEKDGINNSSYYGSSVNSNMDIILDNIDFIQKMLKTCKDNENNIKKKYNLK